MKKVLLCVLLMAVGFVSKVWSQGGNPCSIEQAGFEVVSTTPIPGFDSCEVTIDIFFLGRVRNNGQKFFTAHIWQTAPANNYPNLSYNQPPTAAELGNLNGTIILERSPGNPSNWFLSTQYNQQINPAFAKIITSGTVTTFDAPAALGPGFEDMTYFIISGLKLRMASCENAVAAIDVWGSNAAQNQTVQCFNKNIQVASCENEDPIVFGQIICNVPRQYSISIDNTNGCKPYLFALAVYADDGDGVQDAGDAQVNPGAPDSTYVVVLPGQNLVLPPQSYTAFPNNVLHIGYTSYSFSPAGIVTATDVIIADNGCGALPVKLQSFSAKRNTQSKQSVDITWQTSLEQNNKGFNLQRKTQGEWQTVAFIASKSSNGNSNSSLQYSFTDVNNYKGMSQYRLEQVDFDGRIEFSETRTVTGDASTSSIIIFPNPSNTGRINVMFDNENTKNVLLHDMNGRMLKQWRSYRSSSLTIDQLNSGVYTLRIQDVNNGKLTITKFVVNR